MALIKTNLTAFAHTRLENYGSAVEDANRALALDKTFVKVGPTSLCASVR